MAAIPTRAHSEPRPPKVAMADPIEKLAHDAERLVQELRRVPVSTYRLQMHAGFTLADAERITLYLHSLGVSHVYTSPMTAAKPGSLHGYDVVDHGRLNPEIGTENELASWIAKLRALEMGWILDVVPNHMSVGGTNDWWTDVLEHGPASPFAGYFDVAWNDHPRAGLHGKVLLPILASPYGAEIEAGRFVVNVVEGNLSIMYGSLRLPIDPRTYWLILGPVIDAAQEQLPSDNLDLTELKSISTAVKHLPPRTDVKRAAEGWTECRVIKRRLAELTNRSSQIAELFVAVAKCISGNRADPASFTRLEELLDAQAYRPSFWRVASDEINYRRFFDVNDLAALSTEREDVFVAVHRKVLEWTAAGLLDGLRIDHPDGLFDPKQYLDRLQLFHRLAVARRIATDSLAWTAAEPALRERFSILSDQPLYVVVEKILAENEEIPLDWQTRGTTGYEFINILNGLFVDQASEPAMSRSYRELTGFDERLDELVYVSKFHLLQSSLASELHMLAHQLDRIAQSARWSRDFTLNGLRHALREVIACFPVYRSYVNGGVSDKDRMVVLRAIARARSRNPLLGRAVFDFIRDTLLLKDPASGPATPEYRLAQKQFAGKFQQVTAPAMAKGLEDTALYVHSRLISLNEVGGEPSRYGRSIDNVHHFFQVRADRHPAAMSPLTTHDTKRSEDVRARIDALSEMPKEWADLVTRWMDYNRALKLEIDGELAPDANEEYFLYQTLIGAWPMEGLDDQSRSELVGRIQAYMNKALHEAKVHSSWINPNPEYDAAVAEFVKRILDPSQGSAFLSEFEPFQRRISNIGTYNSLSQSLIRITAPGVPDTYQGTELWDFSLVDPDNRRPVDFSLRRDLLAQLDSAAAANLPRLISDLVTHRADGRIKLFVISRALRYRREHGELFATGNYSAARVNGPQSGHVFCFTRTRNEKVVVVATPRLVGSLFQAHLRPPFGVDAWGETQVVMADRLQGRTVRNVFTQQPLRIQKDGHVRVADLFANFPLALLETEQE